MRLVTELVPAKFVPVDSFIYDKRKKRFFFVDDKDVEETHTTFYFEEGLSEKGISEYTWVVRNEENLIVVMQYKCTVNQQLKEINDEIDQYKLEEQENN